MSERTYEWAHGWIPLTLHAAILKAHGNHEAAERLLAEHRERKAAGPAEFITPLHQAHAEHQARRQLRALTDDQIGEAIAAVADHDDEHLDVLLAELERRDKATRRSVTDRARRERRRTARDTAREADYERRTAAGEDPEAAYAAAYGITAERMRRDELIRHLRETGHKGKGLAELTRAAYTEHADASYWAAEQDTRGVMVNAAGERAGVHPHSLFTGTEARARKYASEELLAYWQQHGRMTLQDFSAAILGGHSMSQRGGNWA